jgi:hypothetical protein
MGNPDWPDSATEAATAPFTPPARVGLLRGLPLVGVACRALPSPTAAVHAVHAAASLSYDTVLDQATWAAQYIPRVPSMGSMLVSRPSGNTQVYFSTHARLPVCGLEGFRGKRRVRLEFGHATLTLDQ